MEKQERRPESRKDSHQKEEVKPNPKVVESGKKMKEDIDKLVDEIDDVLEKNAEEFVKNYVQKGGEESPPFLLSAPGPSLLFVPRRFVRSSEG